MEAKQTVFLVHQSNKIKTKFMKLSTMASLSSLAFKTKCQTFPILSSFYSSSSSSFPPLSFSRSLHNSTNLFSLRRSSFPAISMSTQKRNLSAVSCSISDTGFQDSSFQVPSSFFIFGFFLLCHISHQREIQVQWVWSRIGLYWLIIS